ncbi:histidine phosphatase family protein [Candidatus Woesearchaeota archaeon]|nr:histidine phosphatase family protein [Candidatus Woesearchaeota archaeon]
MLDLYLIRHPETVFNKQKIIQGQLDPELAPGYQVGIEKLAAELARRKPFNHFFSSDLQRAERPARSIVDYLRQQQETPIKFVSTDLLRERHWGDLQSLVYDQVAKDGEELYQTLFKQDQIRNGESLDAIRARVKRFQEEHLRELDGIVGIMGHKYFNTYLINSLLRGGDIIARPYSNWPNNFVRHLEISDQAVQEVEPITIQ